MELKYYKVLGEGLINRGFQWKPGKWNEILEEDINHKEDGEACGTGLHVFRGKPNWNYIPYLPDHTYRVVGVQGLLGKDKEKSRFRRVKLAPLPMTLEEILGENRDGMKGAHLNRANLTRANLTCANLTHANLTDADLTDADLTDADLTYANLTDADLTYANLTGADLTDADLFRANLTRANLTRANLTRANLTRADLTRADLTDAHGCRNIDELSKEQKESAHC